VFGQAAENLGPEQLNELETLLDSYGLQVGCLQSSKERVGQEVALLVYFNYG
jgi:hypothetical protein